MRVGGGAESDEAHLNSAICSGLSRVANFAVSPPDLFTTPSCRVVHSVRACIRSTREALHRGILWRVVHMGGQILVVV